MLGFAPLFCISESEGHNRCKACKICHLRTKTVPVGICRQGRRDHDNQFIQPESKTDHTAADEGKGEKKRKSLFGRRI